MEKISESEIPKHILTQLYDRLEMHGFKKNEWLIGKGPKTSYEGHACPHCHIEDYSGLEIVNKKNTSDKFEGWFNWVHIKPCTEENVKDKSKIFAYWEVIKGDAKTAEKYGVITFSLIGIPEWILNKFGVIYK